MKALVNEFKTFIARGNVMELAVGVVMGSAFGKIVTSLVDNIIMPLLGVITGLTELSLPTPTVTLLLDNLTLSTSISLFSD